MDLKNRRQSENIIDIRKEEDKLEYNSPSAKVELRVRLKYPNIPGVREQRRDDLWETILAQDLRTEIDPRMRAIEELVTRKHRSSLDGLDEFIQTSEDIINTQDLRKGQ